jgi:hypothetical protein
MRVLQPALRTVASVISVLVLVVFLCVGQSKVNAHASQTGPNTPRPPVTRPPYLGVVMPPELTYTNSKYGLSFRFPGNFNLQEYSNLQQGPRTQFDAHGDPDEIVLATLVVPSGSAPPVMMFVGVNPTMSEGSCASLVAPDQWTFGAALARSINGVKFTGRNEVDKSQQFGMQNVYQRQYTAYSHGVCSEFDGDFSTLNPAHTRGRLGIALAPLDLEQTFAQMELILESVQIQTPNPGVEQMGAKSAHITRPWETSLAFPKELARLDDLADWKITYLSRVPAIPLGGTLAHYKICGEGDSDRYLPVVFASGAGPELDDATANAVVDKLNADVIQLLQKLGWKLINSTGGDPNSACYGKDGVYVTTGAKGTDRCTMNSPCNVSDILSFDVYIPVPSAGSTQ